ncbi:MAG: amidohydrolase family protein [Chloroflexi bacterium]|nr:amidohydrolase family protein [Chloroflexota bacterium]
MIVGGRIEAVGPAATLASEPHDEAAEFAGQTILPGLVDAHTHLTLSGTGRTYEQEALEPDEMMALQAVHNALVHLRSGVTTLRDNGGRNRVTFAVREAQHRGFFLGPRMLLSGRPVTHGGGHFHWCNGVADGPEGIRRAIRELVSEGADHIKIMASGGQTAGNDPSLPSYSVEELRVAVETAHGLSRLTTAHCRATPSIVNAVEAGLDCIEHAGFLEHVEPRRYGEGIHHSYRIRYEPVVGERLARSGMFVSLTLQANGYHTLRRLGSPGRRVRLDPLERSRVDEIDRVTEQKLEVVQRLIGLDMLDRLVLSTDAGPSEVDFGRLHYSVELGVAAGMTPMQAIQAVTAVAATACGVGHLVGTLEPGKEADVVVVDGDPLGDIRALSRVSAVYRAGARVVDAGTPPPLEEA